MPELKVVVLDMVCLLLVAELSVCYEHLMSKGNTIDFRAFVENHPKSDLEKADVETGRSYSPEWKSTCLRVLEIFREQQRSKLNRKKFGWQATRDAIMEDFDAKSGRKLAGRNQDLTNNHMKDWARHYTIRDSAFRYIDRFVRKMELGPAYDGVREALIGQNDRRHAEVISEIYQRRRMKEGFVEYLESVSGEFLYSEPLAKVGYQHIVIRFVSEMSGVLKIHVAYCDFDIHKPDFRNIHAALFYEGFLIPVPTRSVDSLEETGLPARTDSWLCWVKLHRPQYRGSLRNGSADGYIDYGVLELSSPPGSLVHIHLRRPNTLVWPTGEIMPLGRDEEENLDKVKLNNNQKNNDFLAEIFKLGYKGYLF